MYLSAVKKFQFIEHRQGLNVWSRLGMFSGILEFKLMVYT